MDVDAEYDSIASCLAEFADTSGWLFRGEASVYATTHSALERVRNAPYIGLPRRSRELIQQAATRLASDLRNFLDLTEMESWGFLQHYEFPTDRFDFTSAPAIAAYFALGAAHPLPAGTDVLMSVLSIDQASRVAEVADLRQHSRAERPRRQEAFTVFVPEDPAIDLKTDKARDSLGLKWCRCQISESDLELFSGHDSVLDAHTDYFAGVLQLLLDGYEKVDDFSAKWLADHVVAAPFITQIVDLDSEGPILELRSTEDSGYDYDEIVERFNNRRIWSNQYPDIRGFGGLMNGRVRKPVVD